MLSLMQGKRRGSLVLSFALMYLNNEPCKDHCSFRIQLNVPSMIGIYLWNKHIGCIVSKWCVSSWSYLFLDCYGYWIQVFCESIASWSWPAYQCFGTSGFTRLTEKLVHIADIRGQIIEWTMPMLKNCSFLDWAALNHDLGADLHARMHLKIFPLIILHLF